MYESVSEIFGANLNTTRGTIEVEVTEGKGAVGFEVILLADNKTIMGLNAFSDFSSRELFSAQMAHIPEILYTNLKVLNTSDSIRRVTFTVTDDDGQNSVAPVSLDILAGQAIEKDVNQLFGINTVFTGSLRVLADGDGVVGDVIFGEPTTLSAAASLMLQSQSFTEAAFSHVVEALGYYTGLALFNPGTERADVKIEVFSDQGNKTGESNFSLGGGRRFSKVLSEVIPSAAGQVKGYTLITSTKPLIGQQLFGSGISWLAALPPTILK
jgi:hypothetical protein